MPAVEAAVTIDIEFAKSGESEGGNLLWITLRTTTVRIILAYLIREDAGEYAEASSETTHSLYQPQAR